jgi:hypothetical protein
MVEVLLLNIPIKCISSSSFYVAGNESLKAENSMRAQVREISEKYQLILDR